MTPTRNVRSARPRTRIRFVVAAAISLLAAILVPAALAAPASAATGTYYVALGDSYTAGYGLPTQLTSPAIIAGCGQSSNSYPHLIAAHYGIALDDRACSGATTAAFTSSQGANPAQDSALGTSTRLVTISMGGNDVGGGTAGCLGATSSCQGGSATYTAELNYLASHLSGDIAHIKSLAPNALIVYIGYLSGLPSYSTWVSTHCSTNLPYYPGDITYLDNAGQQLNNVLKAAAQAEGVTFVDSLSMSMGHDPCEPESTRWVEGIHPVAPATATLHPNLAGEAAYAAMIEAVI
ncbi:MAG TPA: SGNH/GDSL hydrolase family protein [Pseudonocardiaceae bacterium]|jgi:lysophospholipase L1-like esterase|nr:SGNH/GDSL hydrolase family protein [Pseudonocardiaceae bacterium]